MLATPLRVLAEEQEGLLTWTMKIIKYRKSEGALTSFPKKLNKVTSFEDIRKTVSFRSVELELNIATLVTR